ncbi:hypothetical protein [Dactylosporangium sp. NPDC048998]|uniref:hypothetical protein n=1 Tax=Dactylosporangium sp. NPDC048998 TaxID=3363976 RepID=UPI003715BBEC
MTHRLWFRLDDVIPLAEHAMACSAHKITDAQVRAGAPLRPALIWTGTATLDILQSNGEPAWYGKGGTIHAAEAHTWRHTATGSYGTANLDGYHTAYLPLDDNGKRPGLIGIIRDAREELGHWMWVDIDAADEHLIGLHRVGFTEHRDDLVPASAAWVPATVTCDPVAGAAYPALIPDGYTTDAGHLLPRFDRATVGRLAAAHANPDRNSDPMPGEYPRLRLLDDLYGNMLLIHGEHDDGTVTTVREADQVHPDADGRYSVGAYTWPWHLA